MLGFIYNINPSITFAFTSLLQLCNQQHTGWKVGIRRGQTEGYTYSCLLDLENVVQWVSYLVVIGRHRWLRSVTLMGFVYGFWRNYLVAFCFCVSFQLKDYCIETFYCIKINLRVILSTCLYSVASVLEVAVGGSVVKDRLPILFS